MLTKRLPLLLCPILLFAMPAVAQNTIEERWFKVELMIFSHPPKRVADYAHFVLEELHPESLSNSRSGKITFTLPNIRNNIRWLIM